MDPDFGVGVVTQGGLSALVSRVRLEEFDAEALERNLEDRPPVGRADVSRPHDARTCPLDAAYRLDARRAGSRSLRACRRARRPPRGTARRGHRRMAAVLFATEEPGEGRRLHDAVEVELKTPAVDPAASNRAGSPIRGPTFRSRPFRFSGPEVP